MTRPADLEIEVRGGATTEEIAAVLEVLLVRRSAALDGGAGDGAGRYERWRRGRLAALRAIPTED